MVPSAAKVGDAVTVIMRPEDIALRLGGSAAAAPGDNLLQGKVVSASFLGEAMEYQVEMADTALLRLKLHASQALARGDIVQMQIPPSQCRALMA